MLQEANAEIGRAEYLGSHRQVGERRINELIRQIDVLLWEMEALNLRDSKLVPDELLPRITLAVAAATETDLVAVAEVRKPLLALDRLFEAQGRLTRLKSRRRGFVFSSGERGD